MGADWDGPPDEGAVDPWLRRSVEYSMYLKRRGSIGDDHIAEVRKEGSSWQRYALERTNPSIAL